MLCVRIARTLSLVLLAPAAGWAQSPSFQGLGDLPGGSARSHAYGASADGSVVVGSSDNGDDFQTPFRWTSGGGMVALGLPPLRPPGSGSGLLGGPRGALGVSADGAVVVGGNQNGDGETEAWRWTAAGGTVGLGSFNPDQPQSIAHGASANGAVVVGFSVNLDFQFEGFRWTSGGGMQGLGFISGGNASSANGVSADGAVVVGSSGSPSGTQAFRWTSGGGTQGLGDLSGGSFSSFARAVSADGLVVVGAGTSASGAEAFRWTQAGGMLGLGDLPDGSFGSDAFGVSADGSVVVGQGTSANGGEAFIWTADEGMRTLRDVLIGLGVDMTGWTLRGATGVSADGRVVVGIAVNPQGQLEAFRAVLAPSGHRWIDPTGGSWDIASNWEPATVPGPTDRVRFDIPGIYTVFGNPAAGPRTVLGLHASDGTIDFNLDNINLIDVSLTEPSLAVSADAIAKIISGSSTMLAATIGFTDNEAGDTTTTARLQVFNSGTRLSGSGILIIGSGGGEARGELFVAAGELITSSAVVGGTSIGEAIVGNGGEWTVLDGLTVGFGDTGRLTIENGGRVVAADMTINQFADQAGRSARVSVGGFGADRQSELFVFDALNVGGAGPGFLRVHEGGTVTGGQILVGRDAAAADVVVEGFHPTEGELSQLIASSLTVGANATAFHTLTVRNRGLVHANVLTIAAPGGSGFVTVEDDALIAVSGMCSVGVVGSGLGSLAIGEEGELTCQQASVGSSSMTVTIDALGFMVVAGVTNITRGEVRLLLGTLDGIDVDGPPTIDPIDVIVGQEGTISGGGFVIGSMESLGTVSPLVVVVPPDAEAGNELAGGQPATLQVNGRVALRPEGTLAIPLLGADTTQQGRLRVVPAHGIDGSASLAGTLRLDFSNGYAPSTGDTFLLLDAASTTGSFATTEFTGLEPGWQFDIQIVGGTVVLHSLNDGVPTTPAEPDAPPPAGLVLHPPAPNPTSGLTTLRFDLPAADHTQLAVYDALGREVAVLTEATLPAGAHETALQAGRLAPGVYIARLEAGGATAVRRLTVMR